MSEKVPRGPSLADGTPGESTAESSDKPEDTQIVIPPQGCRIHILLSLGLLELALSTHCLLSLVQWALLVG